MPEPTRLGGWVRGAPTPSTSPSIGRPMPASNGASACCVPVAHAYGVAARAPSA